jgi:hypothetical protein
LNLRRWAQRAVAASRYNAGYLVTAFKEARRRQKGRSNAAMRRCGSSFAPLWTKILGGSNIEPYGLK